MRNGQKEDFMQAGNGDRIVIHGHQTGEADRDGEVLAVRAPTKVLTSSGGATPGTRPSSSPVRTPPSSTSSTPRA